MDLPWKPLYRQTVQKEAELEAECSQDPTKKWGPRQESNSGPFAVCFSGGMRNFVAVWMAFLRLRIFVFDLMVNEKKTKHDTSINSAFLLTLSVCVCRVLLMIIHSVMRECCQFVFTAHPPL